MGKNLIQQRRGRGTSTYRAPSHRYHGAIRYRKYDAIEKTGVVKGVIKDLVSCPGHEAPLARIRYETKEETFISAPLSIRIGDIVASGLQAPLMVGCVLPLKNIPDGTAIFNVEGMPGDGGKFARTSGVCAYVVGRTGNEVIVRLPSKKEKLFPLNCRATIGVIAGDGRKEKPFIKAGSRMHAQRSKNKLYPRTSGVAMNAVDHPFGSGRGRHIGKSKTPPRFAPPGRNVGLIHARSTGRKR